MNRTHRKLGALLIITMLIVCVLPLANIYAAGTGARTEQYYIQSNTAAVMLLGANAAGNIDNNIILENSDPDALDDNTSDEGDNNTPEGDDASDGTDSPLPDGPDIPAIPDEPAPPIVYQNPFIDIYEDNWFYEDVVYVFAHQLMMGSNADTFSPDALLTRGMVVTVIYRMAGSPDVTGISNQFIDVVSDKYYTNAVIWATKNSIVNGYDNARFGPDDNITREQLALVLYRFEVVSGKTMPDTLADEEFDDWDQISSYAKAPVNILLTQGIISGKPENRFDPGGSATRAEFAAMLHRFSVSISMSD